MVSAGEGLSEREILFRAAGSWRGLLKTALPGSVYATVWFATGRGSPLPAALAAVGAALCVACLALASSQGRPRNLAATAIGTAGGLVCAGLVWASGSARTYALPGLLLEGVYAVVLGLSLTFGRPLPQILADILLGADARRGPDAKRRRAYRRITWVWSVFFLLESAVKGWLYLARMTGPLLVAKTALDGASVLCLAITWRELGRAA